MIETVNPFPPLIFKGHFDFKQKHIEAAEEILSSALDNGANYLESGEARSSVSNQHTPPHCHPAFEDYFLWQNNQAEQIIKNQYKLAENLNYIVGNSWVNVHERTGKTKPHSHGLAALSTVAYIKLPANSGYTEFKDPHFDLRSLHERSDGDQGLLEWAPVPVVSGDVLFFPGWMQHRSQENTVNHSRWILSSNYINFRLLETYSLGNVLNLN